MGRLSRAAGWGAARLLPAERREWAKAIWAEADEIPSALERLRWYVGGTWLLAKEPLMGRRVGRCLMFAALIAAMASSAWGSATAGADMWVVRALPIATVAVTILLALVARSRIGAVADSLIARSLRISMYLAMALLIVAVTGLVRLTGAESALLRLGPPSQLSAGKVVAWSLVELLLAAYIAAVLAITAQRSRVAPTTLVIGTAVGIVLGATMYAIMPLGVWEFSTAPWLRGTAGDPVVVLAWVLLLIGPFVAGLAAGRCYSRPASHLAGGSGKIRQGIAAGALMTIVASLIVCVLGLLTLAESAHTAWLAQLMLGGHHLSAAADAHRAYVLSKSFAIGYALIWLFFPLIGLGMSALAANIAWGSPTSEQHGNGPGGGGGNEEGPEPPPSPVGEPEAGEAIGVALELVGALPSGT